MSEASPDAPPRPATGLGSSLRSKLGALRRKLVRVEVARRLAVALSVAIAGLALLLALDWWIGFPLDLRIVLLAVLGGVVLVLLITTLTAFVTERRDDESLALFVERTEPGFQSRLIATVQFARGKATVPDGSGQALVDRLIEDTESYAKPMTLTEIVNTGPLKKALLILVLLGGLAAGGYYAGGAITSDLLKRAFLSDIPVPRATRVVWTSGDLKIGIGDTVPLEAETEGYHPAGGTVRIRFASGQTRKVRMESTGERPGRYAATVENVQESFTWVAALSDGRSARQTVRALPRPTVISVTGRQSYPGYTKLAPSDHKPGEFLLFPGSRLDLTITASQPLQSGSVRLLGSAVECVSFRDQEDPHLLHASFTAPDKDLTGFTVTLVDTEEMASQDATVYRVDILNDEAPKVRIVRPSRQRELVTESARVLLAYEAEDRFGIEGLTLHYQVGEAEARSFELPLAGKGARRIEEQFDWDLAGVDPALKTGDEIEFWIEASDENADTAAGKSARRFLKVVTAREKRDDLLSRAGDFLGRVDQATDDQERLNAVLAEWIRAQNSRSAPPTDTDNDQENKNNEN